MTSSKGVVSLGLAIICCVFLLACGGSSSSPPAPKGPPVITTTTLPNAVIGVPYTATIIATGGTGTYTWALTSGSLPAGLTFTASSATISGTPTGPAGNSQFTVQVTDQAQKTASQVVSLYVQGVVMITTLSPLPTGSVGVPYSQQLAATDGIAPYTWTVTTGSLPAGLTLSTSGLISGTPTTNGSPAIFTVQVTDSEPTPSIATAQFSITILTITTSSVPAATINQPYSATLTASGGSGKLSWCVLEVSGACDTGAGSLPPGLMLSSTGTISGTPTKLGTFPFTAKVQDSQKTPASTTANLSITVQFVITTTVLPQGTVGLLYNAPNGYTLMASGGNPPLTWAVISGNLPPGLSLDSSTGVISGTPTSAGTSGFTVQATDASRNTASAPLSIIINPAITNSALTGNYVFTFSGYKSGSLVLMAGSFVADGNGNVTSGVLDYNDGTGEAGGSNPTPQNIVPAQSSYSVQPNGLGTMTLVTDLPATFKFQLAITSNGSGKMIQSDPSQPQDYGSGAIKNHTPLAQGQQWPLCGSYVAVGLFGLDSSLTSRYAAAGQFQFVPSTCVDVQAGGMDINDGGSPSNATFTGAFNQYDSTTSRGIAGMTFKPGGRHFYAFYLVSSSDHKQNELILVSTDPTSEPAPLTLWSGLQQANPPLGWDNSYLAGTAVAELNGVDNQVTADVTAGLFVGNGVAGNNCQNNTYDAAAFNFDENQGGTSSLNQRATGTYCVDKTTGRVTLTPFTSGPFLAPPVFYLVKGGQAFVVGTDLAATSGTLEPQTGSPFKNLTVVGPYTGGTVTPVTTNVTNGATWLAADGAGNMNGTENSNGPGGIGTLPLTYTYQIDNTGRIVFTGTPAAVGYVISPTKMVLFPTTDVNPALSVLTGSNN